MLLSQAHYLCITRVHYVACYVEHATQR